MLPLPTTPYERIMFFYHIWWDVSHQGNEAPKKIIRP